MHSRSYASRLLSWERPIWEILDEGTRGASSSTFKSEAELTILPIFPSSSVSGVNISDDFFSNFHSCWPEFQNQDYDTTSLKMLARLLKLYCVHSFELQITVNPMNFYFHIEVLIRTCIHIDFAPFTFKKFLFNWNK